MRDTNARLPDHSHDKTPIAAALHQILQPFRVLHRIEWSAPWAEEKRCRPACRS